MAMLENLEAQLNVSYNSLPFDESLEQLNPAGYRHMRPGEYARAFHEGYSFHKGIIKKKAVGNSSIKSILSEEPNKTLERNFWRRNLEASCATLAGIAGIYSFSAEQYKNGAIFGLLAFTGAALAYDSYLSYKERIR